MYNLKKDVKKPTFLDLSKIIVFGYDPITKNFVYINDSDNGLDCNLVCGFCGNSLIAKNNCIEIKNHFAHKAGSDCKKGHESTLPLLFKKVLENTCSITLPIYKYALDNSIIMEYGKIHLKNIELEKYEEDLSFNLILEGINDMRIMLIPFMKSNNIARRIDESSKEFEYVMTIDFSFFKNSKYYIEDTIKDLVVNGNFNHICKWVKNKDESILKEKYDLKQKQIEEEELKDYRLRLEERKKPIIVNGVTYYYIEGVESFATKKDKIYLISKDYKDMYLINFKEPYKTHDGYLKGHKINDDGVISPESEIVNSRSTRLWIVK